jgi:hypothetical protein
MQFLFYPMRLGQHCHVLPWRNMCVNDYGIKRKVISMPNLQANAIVEPAHQTLGNLIRCFQLQDKPYYDPDDP